MFLTSRDTTFILTIHSIFEQLQIRPGHFKFLSWILTTTTCCRLVSAAISGWTKLLLRVLSILIIRTWWLLSWGLLETSCEGC